MVKERMDLLELLRKGGMDGDVDFLREALRVLVEGIMDAEVSSRTGAEYGERSPERVTQRNGYRSRAWDTRVGTTPQPLRVEMVLRRGSLSTPRAFKELSIRPTIEVDTCQPRSRIITTSLSFPQRGYCSLRCRTAKANSRDQVGLRSRLGLWLLSSKLLRSLELYRPFHR